jgi:nucleoside-diphosphate-sugar epimerase
MRSASRREAVRLCRLFVLLRPCRDADAEDHPIVPQYPYALSKYQGEQAAFHWLKVYKLPVNSVRIFNAYGTRSRTSGAYGAVFGVFLKQKLAGKPFTVIGDGTQRRDFLYVTDVAAAFLLAAETPQVGAVWNLGAGNPQSVNRLVELLGGPVPFISPSAPASPTAPGRISARSKANCPGRRKSVSRRACSASSTTSSIGATRRCGPLTRSRKRPPFGSRP